MGIGAKDHQLEQKPSARSRGSVAAQCMQGAGSWMCCCFSCKTAPQTHVDGVLHHAQQQVGREGHCSSPVQAVDGLVGVLAVLRAAAQAAQALLVNGHRVAQVGHQLGWQARLQGQPAQLAVRHRRWQSCLGCSGLSRLGTAQQGQILCIGTTAVLAQVNCAQQAAVLLESDTNCKLAHC